MNHIATRTTEPSAAGPQDRAAASMFVTMIVRGQLCGIPVLSVRDIIATQAMTRIPRPRPKSPAA